MKTLNYNGWVIEFFRSEYNYDVIVYCSKGRDRKKFVIEIPNLLLEKTNIDDFIKRLYAGAVV